jgi:hypothetical protein
MTAPSWSRYGSRLRRLCARAGCNAPAVATLRFEPTERLAWLAELDESAARTQGDLCQRHAAALVLPRGWELHDERIAAPQVASDDAQPVEARPVDARPVETAAEIGADARMPVAVEMEEPIEPPDELVEAVEAVEAVEPPAEVEPASAVVSNGNGTRAVPAQFGATDDEAVDEAVTDELDTILDARTPLLQRAFRNARPQGSDA